MNRIKAKNAIRIVEKVLNCVDPRLIDHGKRVAFRVYKMIAVLNKYDERQISDLCVVAMLHDIGAYKTEEINMLLHFETKKIWDHSIYGYLFLKYFSPLRQLAPILLFHHASCKELEHIHTSYRQLSQIVFAADRIDILEQSGLKRKDAFAKMLLRNRDTLFCSDIIDLILDNDLHHTLSEEAIENDSAFRNTLYHDHWNGDDIASFFRMIVLSIDCRSPQTVTHTIATACISELMADLLHVPHHDKPDIILGAWLHDLGKAGIPVEILENPNKLNPEEMKIIRNHIKLTEYILSGNVNKSVFQSATRHHEKLDGSGYPNGLTAKELSLGERIIAVADIFSALYGVRSYKPAFPKNKVIDILLEMSTQGVLDSTVVFTAIEHYDDIIDAIIETRKPTIDAYNSILAEQTALNDETNRIKAYGTRGKPLIIEQKEAAHPPAKPRAVYVPQNIPAAQGAS